MIASNLESVRRRIVKSCEKIGRSAEEIELVCVTKDASLDEIDEVLRLGVRSLGENRVQDAVLKYSSIGGRAVWHMVGHLQTNKVSAAVRIFSLIHSVDSLRLAKEIDKEAQKINKVQDMLIQVNVSGEKTKFGLRPDETANIIREILLYQNIHIKGLMTIAPEVADPELARPYFRMLRQLRDDINELRITNYELRILSMGMSNDFEVAIEEGADIIRIGRAIFKGEG